MNIVCENWGEALDFFLDPRTVERMRRVGLQIVKMDWRNKTVILSCDDDERYAEIVQGLNAVEMSSDETIASPADGWANSLITLSSVL